MSSEPAPVSEAGRHGDRPAPVGLPADPIDTDPAGKHRSPDTDGPDVPDDAPIEQGTAGGEE